MDDAFHMRRIESVRNLDGQIKNGFNLDGSSGDAVLQRNTVQKLHYDKRLAVFFADVMNCANVGVIEC